MQMSKQPNILFIMADQFRADAMSCAGGWCRTPNIDRIAAAGVRYTNCVTTSPVCCPARVSLASGLYPHNTGLWTNKGYTMPTEWRTWMAAIRDAGYRTSLFGKTHLHRHGEGCEDLRECEDKLHDYGLQDVDEICGPHATIKTRCRMTDLWESKGLYDAHKNDIRRRWGLGLITEPSSLGKDYHYDTYVGQAAATYLRDYQGDQPWFCWVSFAGPHEPWDAPDEYNQMFDPADMPEPLPRIQDESPRPKGYFDKHCEQYDAMLANPDKLGLKDGNTKKLRANYAGKVALIDDQIGCLLKILEKRAELENTVIAFTSDHGEMIGDHGLVYKNCFFDGAARIPMLFSTPEMRREGTAGKICPAPTELIDLGPTLAELAGTDLAYEQFGISLKPTFSDPQIFHRDGALCEFMGEVMILTSKWKAAINNEGQVYLLIDLKKDPDEQHNLAGGPEQKNIEDELRLMILEHLSATHKQIPVAGYICE